MVSNIASIRNVNLGAQVAQALREMILNRELATGTRLLEENLAEQFGVSRGPIREAFRDLDREGLVQTRKRGVFVVGLSSDDISDLYALRESLELLAIKQAMDRATQDQFVEAHNCVEQMRAAAQLDDHKAFADADVRFHGLLFTISGNRRLRDVWHQYLPILAAILQSAVGQDVQLKASAEDHAKLLGMIETSDDGVGDEFSAHIRGSRERLIRAQEQLSELHAPAGVEL